MARIQTLDLQQLIDAEKGPIWARNRTSETMSPGGDVFISVNISGTQRVVNVPNTWVPINLTSQVPRKALLDAPYFMEALSKGLIDVITESSAQEILRRDGADEELQRLAERARVIREAVNNRGISKNVRVVNSDREGDEEETAVSTQVQKHSKVSVVRLDGEDESHNEADAVSDSFRAWITKLNSLTQKDAVAEFRRRGTVSFEEATYLVANLKHRNLASRISEKLGATND